MFDDEEGKRMDISSSSQQAGSRWCTSPPCQVSVQIIDRLDTVAHQIYTLLTHFCKIPTFALRRTILDAQTPGIGQIIFSGPLLHVVDYCCIPDTN